MQIVTSPGEMQQMALELRREGKKIGFVPTMGFLHEGHMSLVQLARQQADIVVLSIFVNPLQFGPNEDYERYPHDLVRDSELCRQNGVDIVFYPAAKDMYPGSAEASFSGTKVFVDETDLSKTFCGASRPGHFRGVLTVVAKLFNIVLPDIAVFGQKDAQQAALVRHMIASLNFPVTLVIGPIIREPGGLAMSSRNSYLNPQERQDAAVLSAALKQARRLYRSEEYDGNVLKEAMRALIARQVPAASIDYVEIVEAHSFKPIHEIENADILIVLAVRIGKTRLIDNLPLPDDRLGNLGEG